MPSDVLANKSSATARLQIEPTVGTLEVFKLLPGFTSHFARPTSEFVQKLCHQGQHTWEVAMDTSMSIHKPEKNNESTSCIGKRFHWTCHARSSLKVAGQFLHPKKERKDWYSPCPWPGPTKVVLYNILLWFEKRKTRHTFCFVKELVVSNGGSEICSFAIALVFVLQVRKLNVSVAYSQRNNLVHGRRAWLTPTNLNAIMSFSKDKPTQLLLCPYRINFFHAHWLCTKLGRETVSLTMVFVSDVFRKEKEYYSGEDCRRQKSTSLTFVDKSCRCLHAHVGVSHSPVFSNCTSLHQGEVTRETFRFFYRKNRTSWFTASGLCKEIEGFLPAFRSRKETQDFIALIIFTQGFMYSDAYYIGKRTKVSKTKINNIYNCPMLEFAVLIWSQTCETCFRNWKHGKTKIQSLSNRMKEKRSWQGPNRQHLMVFTAKTTECSIWAKCLKGHCYWLVRNLTEMDKAIAQWCFWMTWRIFSGHKFPVQENIY